MCGPDGIYFNVRLDKDRPCVLVLVGATAEGCKEVIAIEDGQMSDVDGAGDLSQFSSTKQVTHTSSKTCS